MAFRKYQQEIYDALVKKAKACGGSNSVVKTNDSVSEVYYYGNKIAVVRHDTKCATFNNCGFNNASTTARINAVKEFCNDYGYNY
jgi:hypothetical protein